MMTLGGDKDGDQDFDGPEDQPWEQENSVEELDLDDDEPLPWLESSDYEEEEGVDAGRIIGFVIIALLALAIILFLWWHFTNQSTDPELAANGSTIEAADGDFKERPDDPGGKEFEGTGDVAPVVGEGQTREGRMAEGSQSGEGSGSGEGGRPSVDASAGAETSAAATGAAASGGVGVQIAALTTKAAAEQRWRELSGQTAALKGFKYRIQEATVDNSKVYRVQAIAGDRAAATRLCNALKADGISCFVS